jgi:uncharacterized protein (TIGR00369 family)
MSSSVPARHPQLDAVESLPYHRYLGIGPITAAAGRASFELPVAEHCANAFGVLHGGILASLCDVAAYCALVSTLPADSHAATHDLHLSVMRPTSVGRRVRFEGVVVQKGRSLAFLEARALDEDRLLATARITKSLLGAAPAR